MSGWDDLEGGVQVIEQDQSQIDINLLIARAFSTEEGQKVLAWMRDNYLERPCWQPGADSSVGMFREGQNAVIRELESRIRRAKNQS